MDKFNNKYRIASARLRGFDYGMNGAYFITINTHKRLHYFGDVVKTTRDDGEMQLNAIGQLAEKIWMEIPYQFPFVELGNFVVMPNHTHGILIIDNPASVQTRFIASHENDTRYMVKTRFIASQNDTHNTVETRLIASLRPSDTPPKTGGITGQNNPMIHENISRIIRWYKGRCTFEIRKIRTDFNWQSRFYDHIIRDLEAFESIQAYIENNPKNWAP